MKLEKFVVTVTFSLVLGYILFLALFYRDTPLINTICWIWDGCIYPMCGYSAYCLSKTTYLRFIGLWWTIVTLFRLGYTLIVAFNYAPLVSEKHSYWFLVGIFIISAIINVYKYRKIIILQIKQLFSTDT